MKQEIAVVDGRRIILMDSISYITADDRGNIIISGSHGGSAAANYAIQHPPYLVVFNDAGGGKEQAGVIGLNALEEVGVAAVAVYHTSARIGDAGDTWENGIISRVNVLAAAMGLSPDNRVQDAILSLPSTSA